MIAGSYETRIFLTRWAIRGIMGYILEEEQLLTDLRTVMTWQQASDYFREEILPGVVEHYEQDGIPDGPARRETWNNWTDSLCKDGEISDWQYANWSHPDYL